MKWKSPSRQKDITTVVRSPHMCDDIRKLLLIQYVHAFVLLHTVFTRTLLGVQINAVPCDRHRTKHTKINKRCVHVDFSCVDADPKMASGNVIPFTIEVSRTLKNSVRITVNTVFGHVHMAAPLFCPPPHEVSVYCIGIIYAETLESGCLH